MIKINVISNNKAWSRFIKNPNIYIERKVRNLNKNNRSFKNKKIFCTLFLSGENEIKKLNKKFRNKNTSTDVLSFPFHSKKDLEYNLKYEKEIYIGDIIVNFNKIKKAKKTFFISEFNKLWIHGLVHLFGYDHKKDKEYYKMIKIEKRFLSTIN